MKKMKKIISGLLLAVLVLSCLATLPALRLKANAAGESDLTFTLNSTKDGYIVSNCATTASGELMIPATYNGLPVTEIGSSAFHGCSRLTAVTVPDSVVSIASGSFNGCSGLVSLTLPFIGDTPKTGSYSYKLPLGYIFGGTAFTGGVQIQQAQYYSYIGKVSWTFYYIPENLRSVTVTGADDLYGAFSNCTGITSVTVPSSATAIGDYAFYNCPGLTAITIPDSVTSIGKNSFSGCSGLTELTIPDGVTRIGYEGIARCTGLTSITLPDSLTTLGNRAFMSCSGLTSLTLSNQLYTIGEAAFFGCSNLTEITIPESVESIGSQAFSYCYNLTDIYFDGSAPEFGDNIFQSVTAAAYYTPGNTWTETVMQNYGGNITWVERTPVQDVTVTYTSYGDSSQKITIEIFAAGAAEAAYTFTNEAAPANSGSWTAEGVPEGSYTVKVTKANHIAREYTLTVGGDAVTLDVTVCLAGDVNGDGLVNFSDYSQVLSQSKNPASEILVGYTFACGDVNGDGMINFSDYSQVLSQAKGNHTLW